MAALAVVLAAPVSAQTVTVNAKVPFDFVVGGRAMPAGSYAFNALTLAGYDAGFWAVRNASSVTEQTITKSSSVVRHGHRGQVSVVFHRYGNDYFLAEIWEGSDGYSAIGRSIGMSRTERERAKSASFSKPEVVMVLASL
jgi:hypothetical protein